jgi:hypothetical protein
MSESEKSTPLNPPKQSLEGDRNGNGKFSWKRAAVSVVAVMGVVAVIYMYTNSPVIEKIDREVIYMAIAGIVGIAGYVIQNLGKK